MIRWFPWWTCFDPDGFYSKSSDFHPLFPWGDDPLGCLWKVVND